MVNRAHLAYPFGYTVPKNVRITSANSNFQLTIAPWMAEPFGKTLIIEDIEIANLNGGAGTLHLWDQDLTNSGAPSPRGSAGTALISIGFAAANASGVGASQTNVSFNDGSLEAREFRAGIAMQASVLNVQVMANIRIVG